MNRVKLYLFFDYEDTCIVADMINDVMHDNKQLNMFINSIGMIYEDYYFSFIDNNNENVSVEIDCGDAFIVVDSNPEILSLVEQILNSVHFKLQAFTDNLIPADMDFNDSSKFFIKNLNSRNITHGHVAELLMEGLGIVQKSPHDRYLLKTNTISKIYRTEDNYVISLYEDELWSKIPEDALPSIRVHKIGYPNDLIVPRVYTKKNCMECYILNNIELWKIKLDVLNEKEVKNE